MFILLKEMGLFLLKLKVITKNEYKTKYNKANRDKYTILEFRWSDFLEDEKNEIYKETDILYKNSNDTGANTGMNRKSEKKYIDALSGVIAEFATSKFFNDFLNDNWSAYRPIVTTTLNQVDISLNYKEIPYKVEVRSSFVRNGIEFALYALNYQGRTHFDVLGTYKQEVHKSNFESVKDLFMRVLFDIKSESSDNFKDDKSFYTDRKYFISKYIDRDEPFYIVGGMSGDAIIKQKYTKSLSSKDLSQYTSNIQKGEYNVSEISNISDIQVFLNL